MRDATGTHLTQFEGMSAWKNAPRAARLSVWSDASTVWSASPRTAEGSQSDSSPRASTRPSCLPSLPRNVPGWIATSAKWPVPLPSRGHAIDLELCISGTFLEYRLPAPRLQRSRSAPAVASHVVENEGTSAGHLDLAQSPLEVSLMMCRQQGCAASGRDVSDLQQHGLCLKVADQIVHIVYVKFATLWTHYHSTHELHDDKCSQELACISSLAAHTLMRKLLGYVWMAVEGDIPFSSIRTRLLQKTNVSQWVSRRVRAGKLGKEHKTPLYLAQLDLKKASDHQLHSLATEALHQNGVPRQILALNM